MFPGWTDTGSPPCKTIPWPGEGDHPDGSDDQKEEVSVLVRLCPICGTELRVTGDNDLEEELDCDGCGAMFARLKGTSAWDVVFPGVVCPACHTHDVAGQSRSERPFSALTQLQKEDFIFRCPRTRKLKEVSFGKEGLEVTLA